LSSPFCDCATKKSSRAFTADGRNYFAIYIGLRKAPQNLDFPLSGEALRNIWKYSGIENRPIPDIVLTIDTNALLGFFALFKVRLWVEVQSC
jgi:hypothetical protein